MQTKQDKIPTCRKGWPQNLITRKGNTVDRYSVTYFVKSIVPDNLTMLPWKATCPKTYKQHKLVLLGNKHSSSNHFTSCLGDNSQHPHFKDVETQARTLSYDVHSLFQSWTLWLLLYSTFQKKNSNFKKDNSTEKRTLDVRSKGPNVSPLFQDLPTTVESLNTGGIIYSNIQYIPLMPSFIQSLLLSSKKCWVLTSYKCPL